MYKWQSLFEESLPMWTTEATPKVQMMLLQKGFHKAPSNP